MVEPTNGPIVSGSKYGIDQPPCAKPPSVSSSGPPGACTTPSRLMNSLATIRIVRSCRFVVPTVRRPQRRELIAAPRRPPWHAFRISIRVGGMDLGLTGRVVVVTGGASNIGRAICFEFAREGAVVALFDRDRPMADRTAAEIRAEGGTVAPYLVDLIDVDATAAAVAAVEADHGPIAVLVNNV